MYNTKSLTKIKIHFVGLTAMKIQLIQRIRHRWFIEYLATLAWRLATITDLRQIECVSNMFLNLN